VSVSLAARRSIGVAASLALLAGGSAAFATTAHAVGCTPVTTSWGAAYTASVVDTSVPPAAVVDATGCDIGVYYDAAGSNDAVNGATVQNAARYGVLVDGATNVSVTNSTIQNIGTPATPGLQQGVGVAYYAGSTGTVSNNTVRNYQKNGINVGDAGTNVSVTGNTVTGWGRTPIIAQNGIQVSDQAAATVRGNTVTDNYYTGCSNQDAAKTGCVPYVATGILLYNISQPAVDTSNNFYRNDQRNLYNDPKGH
jgi:hypothetical protein